MIRLDHGRGTFRTATFAAGAVRSWSWFNLSSIMRRWPNFHLPRRRLGETFEHTLMLAAINHASKNGSLSTWTHSTGRAMQIIDIIWSEFFLDIEILIWNQFHKSRYPLGSVHHHVFREVRQSCLFCTAHAFGSQRVWATSPNGSFYRISSWV